MNDHKSGPRVAHDPAEVRRLQEELRVLDAPLRKCPNPSHQTLCRLRSKAKLDAVIRELDGRLVGVAVIARPRARLVDQYRMVEVSRLATDGTKNICSFLYSRCARMCREWGFDAVFTCILESESGVSLRAAGWEFVYPTRGGTQDRPSRRRVDKSPIVPKQVWAPPWSVPVLRAKIARAA